ncbi:putative universal stress protein A [Helianthus annuus]|nr:putative universal stress protein A [Helianthus annuus]
MEDQEKKKKKVMVAIDQSEYSRYALEWALENLHDSIANNHLLIFSVQPISDYSYLQASAYGATPPELIRNIQENQKKVALNLLDQAKDLCNKYGITAETMTEVGDPKELIYEAVEKLKVQLLVLGSSSRGFLKRAFLGSVSNHCVQNVKCPVLVVKKTV